MPIVPADEATYRRRIRHRLTLDLFTRYGTFWDAIADLRDTWEITPTTAIPPEPPFHVESVGLMSRYQMAERFHMPDWNAPASVDEAELRRVYREHGFDGIEEEIRALNARDRRLSVGLFLNSLRDVWKAEIGDRERGYDDLRSGTNITGWMSWVPFLSACVLYDPPAYRLLDFADHDDHEAAKNSALTYWQDPDIARDAYRHRETFEQGDARALFRFGARLRESFIESDTKPQSAGRGNPSHISDSLRDAQCAVMALDGISNADIGKRLSMKARQYEDDYGVRRVRPNAVEKAIRRGKQILSERDYVRLKSG